MGMSVRLSTVGKFLDQPALLENIHKVMPATLIGVGGSYAAYNASQAPEGQKGKKMKQNACIMGATIISALLATRGLKIGKHEFFEGLIEPSELNEEGLKEVAKKVKDNKVLSPLVEKVEKGKLLGFKQITKLEDGLDEIYGKGERAIAKVIPDAEAEENAFGELWSLSKLGLIPVLGGIAGGVLGDKITGENWKKKFPNKVKEGTYQYLNNIFLCNVGAGIAVVTMNALKVKNKAIRAAAMLAGVIGVGIIAGSAIANFIGKNYINPIFNKKAKRPKSFKDMTKDLNSERHPEAIDLSLHIDDIASVGFLSGFKWIGPILPALYMVSAYRAGEGYRNGKDEKQKPAAIKK